MHIKQKDADILERYRNGNSNEKKTLEFVFGSDAFNQPAWEDLDASEKSVLMAYHRLRRNAEIKREKWTPNYADRNQVKYYPYFEWKDGVGFVVDGTFTYRTYASSTVGSRLVFPTEEMAIEFAKENIEDYKIILEQ